MKTKIIFLIILGIIIIGTIFLIFSLDSNKDSEVEQSIDRDFEVEKSIDRDSETNLQKSISVSTKEELFQEIRNSVDEHLRIQN